MQETGSVVSLRTMITSPLNMYDLPKNKNVLIRKNSASKMEIGSWISSVAQYGNWKP